MSILKSLGLPCLTEDVVTLLQAAGIRSVDDLLLTNKLKNVTTLTTDAKDDLLASVVEAIHAPLISARDMLEIQLHTEVTFPCQSSSLNQVLQGGFQTGCMVELEGQMASGKTQICFSTIARALMETQHHVLYLDSTQAFNVERIVQICRQINPETPFDVSILHRIRVVPVFTVWDLLSFLDQSLQRLSNDTRIEEDIPRLIILDSVTTLLSPLLGCKSKSGHAVLVLLAKKLKLLARTVPAAVITTNYSVSNGNNERSTPAHSPGSYGGQTPITSQTRLAPALGRTWLGVPDVRLHLSQTWVDGVPVTLDGNSQKHVDGGELEYPVLCERRDGHGIGRKEGSPGVGIFDVYWGGLRDIA